MLEMETPALLTITSEQYQLRYATMPNIMAASMKEVTNWSGADLGLDDASSRIRQARLFQPEERTECELIDAESPGRRRAAARPGAPRAGHHLVL